MNAFSSENLPLAGKGRVYSLAVLQHVALHPNGARFMELYRRLHGHIGISKPTLSYTLRNLITDGYLTQAATGLYLVTKQGKEYLDKIRESEEDIISRIVDLLIGRVEERKGGPLKDIEERRKLAKHFREKTRRFLQSEAYSVKLGLERKR